MSRGRAQGSSAYLWPIASMVLLLLTMGLLMLASSSLAIANHTFGSPFHYFIRQCVYLVMGLLSAVVTYHIPLSCWYRYRKTWLFLALLLLLLLYVPGIGVSVNGARRWLRLGVINLEVCEIVKVTFVIFMAGYVADQRDKICQRWSGFLVPSVILVTLVLLLLTHPDFGTVIVLFGLFLFMLFMAGFPLRRLLITALISGVLLTFVAILEPYRVMRLVSFVHPWEDPYNHGYQLTQSLMAIGRGGVLGQGLGNGIQKFFYLPEAHTDFIYAVLCEELGLIGGVLIIACFATLFFYTMQLGRSFERDSRGRQSDFAAYLAYGMAAWLALQSIVNVGVSTGCLPTKGLTLPLISYGGSHILMTMAALGILLRMAVKGHESYPDPGFKKTGRK